MFSTHMRKSDLLIASATESMGFSEMNQAENEVEEALLNRHVCTRYGKLVSYLLSKESSI